MDICLAGNVVTQKESHVCAQPLQLNIDASQIKCSSQDRWICVSINSPFNTYTKYIYSYSYQHLLNPEHAAGPGLDAEDLKRQ